MREFDQKQRFFLILSFVGGYQLVLACNGRVPLENLWFWADGSIQILAKYEWPSRVCIIQIFMKFWVTFLFCCFFDQNELIEVLFVPSPSWKQKRWGTKSSFHSRSWLKQEMWSCPDSFPTIYNLGPQIGECQKIWTAPWAQHSNSSWSVMDRFPLQIRESGNIYLSTSFTEFENGIGTHDFSQTEL